MQQQLVDIIYLPFVTGLVGYFTNKLAIKMLFRPYRARWYTLGWQGVVPRTRPVLAKKIACVVGGKLIARDDILAVISGNDFRIFLQNAVSLKLAKITGKDIEALLSGINVRNMIEKNSGSIDAAGRKMLDGVMSRRLSEFMEPETMAEKAGEYIAPKAAAFISSEISGFINNTVYSGKTLEEILPGQILRKTDDIAAFLAGSAAEVIKASGRSAAVKDAAAEKAIAFKNSFFGGGGSDMLKMGLLNMFLDDETISDTVKRELPSFLDNMAENESVRENIEANIKAEIKKILGLKLADIIERTGENALPSLSAEICSFFSSAAGREKITNAVKRLALEAAGGFSSMTLKAIIEKTGAERITERFSLSGCLLSRDTGISVSEIADKTASYINSRSYEIALPVTEKIIEALKSNLESILESINIEKTVEDKINSLPLNEVENILFSFMRAHFKWINILGFAIGFAIGCVQLAVTGFI